MRALIARDVMSPDLLTVSPDMTVAELAEFLVENEISGAPVADVDGQLIGVVSLSDVARDIGGRDQAVLSHPEPDFYLRGWEEKFNAEDLAGLRIAESDTTVGEIMTPSIFAVDEETPIGQVAERMIDSKIHRMLVTREKKPVGILTTTDLLGLLVEEPVHA